MKLRSDSVDPNWMKSKTERELPRRCMPYKEIVEPMRKKLRKDKVDPRWRKSNTDMADPKRCNPYTDSVLPKRK
jgi:hypothetical protein